MKYITLEPRGSHKTDPFVKQDRLRETGPDMARSFTHKRPNPDTIPPSSRSNKAMPCGHPRSCIVQVKGGTAYCGWCEEVARFRGAMLQVLSKCCAEVARLRKELEQHDSSS